MGYEVALNLFDQSNETESPAERLGPGAVVLRGFARAREATLLAALRDVTAQAAFRHMVTPGGYRMSVGMTNCGALGWVTDRTGYRYDPIDPETGRPWPELPDSFRELAESAAARAGCEGFVPDFHQPIVSVSLGIPAVFLFGGLSRSAKAERGPSPLVGRYRVNLTFRKAA